MQFIGAPESKLEIIDICSHSHSHGRSVGGVSVLCSLMVPFSYVLLGQLLLLHSRPLIWLI